MRCCSNLRRHRCALLQLLAQSARTTQSAESAATEAAAADATDTGSSSRAISVECAALCCTLLPLLSSCRGRPCRLSLSSLCGRSRSSLVSR